MNPEPKNSVSAQLSAALDKKPGIAKRITQETILSHASVLSPSQFSDWLHQIERNNSSQRTDIRKLLLKNLSKDIDFPIDEPENFFASAMLNNAPSAMLENLIATSFGPREHSPAEILTQSIAINTRLENLIAQAACHQNPEYSQVLIKAMQRKHNKVFNVDNSFYLLAHPEKYNQSSLAIQNMAIMDWLHAVSGYIGATTANRESSDRCRTAIQLWTTALNHPIYQITQRIKQLRLTTEVDRNYLTANELYRTAFNDFINPVLNTENFPHLNQTIFDAVKLLEAIPHLDHKDWHCQRLSVLKKRFYPGEYEANIINFIRLQETLAKNGLPSLIDHQWEAIDLDPNTSEYRTHLLQPMFAKLNRPENSDFEKRHTAALLQVVQSLLQIPEIRDTYWSWLTRHPQLIANIPWPTIAPLLEEAKIQWQDWREPTTNYTLASYYLRENNTNEGGLHPNIREAGLVINKNFWSQNISLLTVTDHQGQSLLSIMKKHLNQIQSAPVTTENEPVVAALTHLILCAHQTAVPDESLRNRQVMRI